MICPDCEECFEDICKKYYMFDLNRYPNNEHELNMYPSIYWQYYMSYEYNNIIKGVKNDNILYSYLKKYNMLSDEGICYYEISQLLLIDKFKKDNFHIRDGTKALIDYLYWSYGSPFDENNILRQELIRKEKIKKEEEKKKLELSKKMRKKQLELKKRIIKDKYRKGEVKIRVGQSQYKEDLIYLHGKCQICGMENKRLLKASHIKPYSKSEKNEAIDFENGFLLCAHHDGLFDSGLITFADDGSIIISDRLSKHDRKLPINNGIENIKINIEEEQKKYLKWHRRHIFK